MKNIYTALFLFSAFLCKAQLIITTVAGNGTATYAGNGSAATAAGINLPTHIAFDKQGNMFIADYNNHAIRKVDVAGIITTVAGTGVSNYSGDNGPATSATLHSPMSVAFDTSGNLYIADSGNSRIRKVNTGGTITTFAGTGVAGYNSDGIQASAAKLNWPADLCFDKAGNLFVMDEFNGRIRKINTAGVISTIAGNGGFGYSGDGGLATAAQINQATGVVVDKKGTLYIADRYNHVVRKVDTLGIISTIAGTGLAGYNGDSLAATSSQIFYTNDVEVDSNGTLYLVDEHNNSVRMLDTSGKLIIVAGSVSYGFAGDGGPATQAKFGWPGGMAFDAAGYMYIMDSGNNRVRKISPLNPTGIKNNKEEFIVYPNPAHDVLTIGCQAGGGAIHIYNAMGEQVLQFERSITQADISGLTPGLYFAVNKSAKVKFCKE